MQRGAWVASLLLAPLVAGCLGGAGPEPAALNPGAPPVLGAGRASAAWLGTAGLRGERACGPDACNAHAFAVAPRAEGAKAMLTVARWPHQGAELGLDGSDPSYQFDVLGPGGAVLGEGRLGWLGAVLSLEDPAPGDYAVRVWATRTGGAYEVGATLVPRPTHEGPPVRLLPDLVTMPLTELAIATPDGIILNGIVYPAWAPLAGPLGVRGCGLDEWAEDRATRCLRSSNGIANLGAGPVEVRLALEDVATGVAGNAQFVQRIYASDGSWVEEPAGPAEFHPIHAHYHFAAFSQTTIHAHDPATATRGEALVVGEKLGYCFIDVGVYAVDHAPTREPAYGVDGCLEPTAHGAAVSGLQPGWFDLYWSGLSHQYMEITGLPDGVYELVSVANVAGRVQELDPSDNEASVVFRLTGDRVEVLGPG